MSERHIAVIDIGKTNAKLALVNASDLSEIAVITRPNTVKSGPPWPHFDVEGHWAFLLEGLRDFQSSHGIQAISVTTHGASVVLLAANGELAAPVLDYEHNGPEECSKEYDDLRPPFAETGSPKLANGLNIGAQLYWQFKCDPSLKERTIQIVTYPQYWGFRLTGVAATDVTSLGCHTDLWNPHQGEFSSLVQALGIEHKIAPARRSNEVIGCILPEIALQTGLPPETPVYCGIHDSNASLLPYILGEDTPFSVVSTGTWVVAMSVGGDAVELDPNRDTLINVNALGDPVPSARFMGGREHDIASGGSYREPSEAELADVLRDQIMLLPSVVPDTGPFQGRKATWIGNEPEMGSARRGVAVSFYLALVTAECLKSIGHKGKIIVEGPFAANNMYLQMLAEASKVDVYPSLGATGTSEGAAMLVTGSSGRSKDLSGEARCYSPLGGNQADYVRVWQQKIEQA